MIKSIGQIPTAAAQVYGNKTMLVCEDRSLSFSELDALSNKLASALVELGVQVGDRVTLCSPNCWEWVVSYYGILKTGAVVNPINVMLTPSEVQFIANDCGASVVIASHEKAMSIQSVKENSNVRELVAYGDEPLPDGMLSFNSVLDAANDSFEIPDIDPLSLSTIGYTSGTTGRPKGVILSNHNIIKTSEASSSFDKLNASDNVLAYLPMAWVGDFIFSIGQACWTGFCVSCPENTETMQQDLKEIGPTYFFAPPRYFEGLLTNVMIRMEDASAVKRFLFSYFMDHAQKIGGNLLDGHSVSVFDKLKYAIGQLFIYGPLRNTLGLSNVRVGYTAGEAIGPEIFDFYRSIGINLKQLYGQTEASVYITQQPDGQVRSDTVGIASPGVELKISDSGEVFYRSPGTFVEYFKNPKSTKETKDAEGWVATGDAGFIEAETGHLRIIDRAKDVGKMEDGHLFAPKYVENKLKFFPNVLECVVFGAGRKFCTAFINIDLNAVGNWAERNNIAYSSYQELAGHKNVYEMIKDHINETNESLADDDMLSGCQIHRFVILHKELDADDGELTRTRKVRRRVIEDKFHDLINALYDGSSEVYTETEVTYEDGTKGAISATLAIADVMPVAQKGKAA